MIETSTPNLAVDRATANLFYYRNTTSRIQIVRVDQVVPQRLEKVVFPGQQILFYGASEASFDIYTSAMSGLTLIERVPCSQLKVFEHEG